MSFNPKIININNLRVVLVKDTRQSVTVEALVGTGSREETDFNAGTAHFLEHFVFKGTKKYKKMNEFNEQVERVGGAFNAYTSKNEMGFWIKMSKDKLDLSLNLLSEIIQNPLLPKEHFEKEKNTIIEELKMGEDSHSTKVYNELCKIMYKNNSSQRPVIGTLESLNNLSIKDLKEYHDKWFISKNIIIGVVGNYKSEEEVITLIKKHFSKLINDNKELYSKDIFKWNKLKTPNIKITKRKVDQAYVNIGFKGLSINEDIKEKEVLRVINTILGSGWLSRLYTEVREERGWAYSVSSGYAMYNDYGVALISAGLPKDKINEAISLILDITYGLAGSNKYKITENDIEIAKGTLKGRIALAFDKPEVVLDVALDQLNTQNKIIGPKKTVEMLDKVTLSDVKRVCNRIFKPNSHIISILGDYKKSDIKI